MNSGFRTNILLEFRVIVSVLSYCGSTWVNKMRKRGTSNTLWSKIKGMKLRTRFCIVEYDLETLPYSEVYICLDSSVTFSFSLSYLRRKNAHCASKDPQPSLDLQGVRYRLLEMAWAQNTTLCYPVSNIPSRLFNGVQVVWFPLLRTCIEAFSILGTLELCLPPLFISTTGIVGPEPRILGEMWGHKWRQNTEERERQSKQNENVTWLWQPCLNKYVSKVRFAQ